MVNLPAACSASTARSSRPAHARDDWEILRDLIAAISGDKIDGTT